MVNFGNIEYRHCHQVNAFAIREARGEDIEIEFSTFVIELVTEWDFVDEESGEELPVDVSALSELNLRQIQELHRQFRYRIAEFGKVEKRGIS